MRREKSRYPHGPKQVEVHSMIMMCLYIPANVFSMRLSHVNELRIANVNSYDYGGMLGNVDNSGEGDTSRYNQLLLSSLAAQQLTSPILTQHNTAEHKDSEHCFSMRV